MRVRALAHPLIKLALSFDILRPHACVRMCVLRERPCECAGKRGQADACLRMRATPARVSSWARVCGGGDGAASSWECLPASSTSSQGRIRPWPAFRRPSQCPRCRAEVAAGPAASGHARVTEGGQRVRWGAATTGPRLGFANAWRVQVDLRSKSRRDGLNGEWRQYGARILGSESRRDSMCEWRVIGGRGVVHEPSAGYGARLLGNYADESKD